MLGREEWSAATGISRSELLRQALMAFEAPQGGLENEAEVGNHLEGVRLRRRRSGIEN